MCVDGVEVTFSFAKKQFFYDEILASSPQDMLLVISGAGSTGLTSINQTWLDQVSVIDENGRRDLIAFAPIIDTLANPGQFLWVLNVSKNSSKFSLHLPGDKTVDLAPLLWRLSLEASPTDDNK
ncbi:MAG: hypothetical protein BZY81_02710 [SAR202 cluster bacterium Io17-Chloro-G4]|nr:MAG: hypothetical protein BZY81_02710 [SAR202 cluster bacterium Io17-Chloro-G4]